jgi:hypothetical protein
MVSLMRVVLLILVLVAGGAVWAEESRTNYWIERYPGDGMKQRPKSVGAAKPERIVSPEGLTEVGPSSTNAVVSTNAKPRAARYTSPRVGSKEFAPSRLPEPKTRTVVIPDREKKLPPSPTVSDKVGTSLPEPKPNTEGSSTNAPPPAGEHP